MPAVTRLGGPRLRRAIQVRVGGLPRQFWHLWTASLVNRLGTFVEPFLALYLTTARGMSLAGAGAVVALNGAGSLVAQPLGGTLTDRLGRKPTMMGSMLVTALALGLLGAAHAIWLLAIAAFLAGVAADTFRPAAQAVVADIVPVEHRIRASGLVFWAVNIGFAVAAVAGGALAAGGYELLFAIDAATCLIYGAIVWRALDETRPEEAKAADAPGWSRVLRDRMMLAFCALQLGAATVLVQMFSTLPLAMNADGYSPAVYGAVAAVNGIVVVVAYPLLSTRINARDPNSVLVAAAILVAAGAAITAPAESPIAYGVGVAVFTLGEICLAAVGPGVVSELAPPALRGRYGAVYGLSYGLSFTIAPIAGAALLGSGDAPTPWLAGTGLCLIVAAGQLALGPSLARRRAEVLGR